MHRKASITTRSLIALALGYAGCGAPLEPAGVRQQAEVIAVASDGRGGGAGTVVAEGSGSGISVEPICVSDPSLDQAEAEDAAAAEGDLAAVADPAVGGPPVLAAAPPAPRLCPPGSERAGQPKVAPKAWLTYRCNTPGCTRVRTVRRTLAATCNPTDAVNAWANDWENRLRASCVTYSYLFGWN